MTAPSGHVAVVGAGAARLVAELADIGYAVTAIDISPTAVSILRSQVNSASTVECRIADVRSVAFDRPVDTWHDRAVFHFFTEDADQRAYVARAEHAVRPGGHLVLATFAPEGPQSCSGLPVARHGSESLAATFHHGFVLLDAFEVEHETPWGDRQRFTHAVLRRRADLPPAD